jgi:hypothetical protein
MWDGMADGLAGPGGEPAPIENELRLFGLCGGLKNEPDCEYFFFDANAIRNHGALNPFEMVPLIFPATACSFQQSCSGGAITLPAEGLWHLRDFWV